MGMLLIGTSAKERVVLYDAAGRRLGEVRIVRGKGGKRHLGFDLDRSIAVRREKVEATEGDET